jgi:hypothetical protein
MNQPTKWAKFRANFTDYLKKPAITEWLLLIVAAIAAGVAYAQYLKSVELEKAAKTISLFVQYNSEPIIRSRSAIFSALDSFESEQKQILDQIRETQNSGKYKAPEEVDKELSGKYIGLIEKDNNKLRRDLDVVLGFLDGMATCVELEVCDKKSAVSLFCGDVTLIKHTFWSYVVFRRGQGEKSLGAHMGRFVCPRSKS